MKHSLLAAALFGWCCALLASSAAPTEITPKAQYATTLAEARQAYQQALQRKNTWRDTKKLLRAAEKAASNGNYAQAHQLAAKARQQGLNAVRQYDDQIGIGNPGYLYQ
ncbi:MAG: hypothetical protein AAF669_04520 [Pseudomonadota bacterium]